MLYNRPLCGMDGYCFSSACHKRIFYDAKRRAARESQGRGRKIDIRRMSIFGVHRLYAHMVGRSNFASGKNISGKQNTSILKYYH